jgi:hypothetical protein
MHCALFLVQASHGSCQRLPMHACTVLLLVLLQTALSRSRCTLLLLQTALVRSRCALLLLQAAHACLHCTLLPLLAARAGLHLQRFSCEISRCECSVAVCAWLCVSPKVPYPLCMQVVTETGEARSEEASPNLLQT